jgi:chitinase
MTYDFHGVWDKPNKWVGPHLNAHTNLTEITDAMDLLWRNDIPMDKVSLALAFYGRGFTATSPSCLSPGCTFESGSDARSCSREISVVLNSEIDEIISSRGITPTLNQAAAVKILIYDNNQWLAYDDEQTLSMKANFARSQCMGGVMVWAISHDTHDAKYSFALGRVAPANNKPQYANNNIEQPIQQCRWTSCKESTATLLRSNQA